MDISTVSQNPTVAALIGDMAGAGHASLFAFFMWRRDTANRKASLKRCELIVGNGVPIPIFDVDPNSRSELTFSLNGVDVSSVGTMLFYIDNTGTTEIKDLKIFYEADPVDRPDVECILFCQHYPTFVMGDVAISERVAVNSFRVDVSFINPGEKLYFEVFLAGKVFGTFGARARHPGVDVKVIGNMSLARPALPPRAALV